jgi:hypothetical protein
MKKIIIILSGIFFLITSASSAQMLDERIKTIALELADQIVANGGSKVAVTIIDYKSCASTEFGKYLAEELTGYLSTSGRKMSVVNQRFLETLLEQNNLSAKHILETQNEAAKLGKVSGINALIYGSITVLGEDLKLSLSVVRLPTLEVYGFAKSSLLLTNGIKGMLECQKPVVKSDNVSKEQVKEEAPDSNDCKTRQYCKVCVTNQSSQDIVSYFQDYGGKYKKLLINPNTTECWREVFIEDGKDFEEKYWYIDLNNKNVVSEPLNIEACKVYNKIYKD